MITLHPSFKLLLLKERGEGVNPLVEVTVNSKKENSEDFCPNYVQEFWLCSSYEAVHITIEQSR